MLIDGKKVFLMYLRDKISAMEETEDGGVKYNKGAPVITLAFAKDSSNFVSVGMAVCSLSETPNKQNARNKAIGRMKRAAEVGQAGHSQATNLYYMFEAEEIALLRKLCDKVKTHHENPNVVKGLRFLESQNVVNEDIPKRILDELNRTENKEAIS